LKALFQYLIVPMKRWFHIFLIPLFFACNDSDQLLNSRPSGVLSKEKMTQVILDINLAESSMRFGNVQHTMISDSIYQKSQYLEVFSKNDVKPEDFNKSLMYYAEHIDDLNDIYTAVINRLTEMQAKLQGNSSKKPESKINNKGTNVGKVKIKENEP
jgi:hypothetical protein